MRLVGSQSDGLVEVAESRRNGIPARQIQLATVLEGLPQSGTQAYRFRKQGNCLVGPALRCEMDCLVQHGCRIGHGRTLSPAHQLEIRADEHAEASHPGSTIKSPASQEEPAGD